MITISKKARLSLQALMFGATLLTGVSALAMDKEMAPNADKASEDTYNDEDTYNLNVTFNTPLNIEGYRGSFTESFQERFGRVLFLCARHYNSSLPSDKAGERYLDDEKPCDVFMRSFERKFLSDDGIVRDDAYIATNNAHHAYELANQDWQVKKSREGGDEARELYLRRGLALLEKNAIADKCEKMVMPTELELKNRMAYLEYKEQVRANEEAAKSNSNNNAQ
jgi:hypothetical protein